MSRVEALTTFRNFIDTAIFGVCELLGLAFGLPFGEDLFRDPPIASQHWIYLAVGIVFAVLGPLWLYAGLRISLYVRRTIESLGPKGRRYLAYAFIAIGAICLSIGILFLANPPQEARAPTASLSKETADDATNSSQIAQPYRLTTNNLGIEAQPIIRNIDGATIPADQRNGDFRIYKSWLAVGNKPDPPTATLPRKYAPRSPSDADREIKIIDQIDDILRVEAPAGLQMATSIANDWPNAVNPEKLESFAQAFAEARASIEKTTSKLRDVTSQVPQFCENDLCLIVDIQNNLTVIDAINKIQLIFAEISGVVDPIKLKNSQQTSRFIDVLAPHLQAAHDPFSAYETWIVWTRQQLQKRRIQLSEIASRQP